MWIVRFALQTPYTFVIDAVLIAIFGRAAIAPKTSCWEFPTLWKYALRDRVLS